MTANHYENFPVASFLLPARLRPAVQAIYAFARSADDIADEGDASAEERLSALNDYEAALDRIEQRKPAESALFASLHIIIKEYALPIAPFRALLSAFKQDVVTSRYANFEDLSDYCRRSANPVGCLMLHLYGAATAQNMRDSDAICSALQLINFWQDVAIDWDKQRIYLPLEDLRRFGVSEAQIDTASDNQAWRDLMQFEVFRVRKMMLDAAPLALRLPGRIGWELRLVVQGGLRILELLEKVDYDVFRRRPKLGKFDWCILAVRAIRMR
ncbi:squalene synthase HpnC [Glaciimonas sp. Gout2]|uniref:squalene synthase HpnC n=1 Tax=unclassified Glaciimonas TaxID=2644401 RepID=UPI002B233311|nr:MULTISPECIES: squalene synthase HpnC [unclassified Glaciimonas]MEB0010020.1 squalene synthase HpnC [Glaciimonas sp. Cout2]MEB0081865.1 squalene synthase HpnC [Glaciimonas sp. Gout2]